MSDFELDEDIRENNREINRLRKRDEKRKNNIYDICDFVGKPEGGLKLHKTKKEQGPPSAWAEILVHLVSELCAIVAVLRIGFDNTKKYI